MDLRYISAVCDELKAAALGSRLRRVFQLGDHALAFELGRADGLFLFADGGSTRPRLYLIERQRRELERSAAATGSFAQYLRKHLSNPKIIRIEQLAGERIVRFDLEQSDDIADAKQWSLIFQLTGRSANIFLLDDTDTITMSLREDRTEGRRPGEAYSPPERISAAAASDGEISMIDGSVSKWLDLHYTELEAEERFRTLAETTLRRVKNEIGRRTKLVKNLRADLDQHGDAETWKKYGDLLLANSATAARLESGFAVTDYFDETAPTIEIPHFDLKTPAETAEKYFKRYTKARNARGEIEKRLNATEAELESLRAELAEIEAAIENRDEEFLRGKTPNKARPQKGSKKQIKAEDARTYAREFVSSDGFEILVGKRSKDNDHLTFRIARSLDTWLHAADYPGSHVVIRAAGKNEIPQRTLVEAAELAAFYSQAKGHPKAAVHYTQKKFVNKPKGAAPGLVRLASFKTLLVEPKITAKQKDATR
ncbi:MAG: NFACT family protein [Acidobacteria bacterium]|nr:NFACT family protein [Acidobacteriota bacterium]